MNSLKNLIVNSLSIILFALLLPKSRIGIYFSWVCLAISIIVGVLLPFFNMAITKAIAFFRPKHIFTKSKVKKIEKDNSELISIVTIILNAVNEELIFRGVLLYFLLFQVDLCNWLSIIIESLIFAILHFSNRMLELCIIAVTLSIMTVYWNNLLPAMICHIINNIIVFFRIKTKKDRKKNYFCL